MPRGRITTAEYIEGIDPEMRIILAELSEDAAPEPAVGERRQLRPR
jgi:hypothetical protein